MKTNGSNLGYNAPLKSEFARLAKAAAREIQSELPFVESKISYNKAGIACSGEVGLMGMFENGVGIYIKLDEPAFSNESITFLYRTITGMKDYSGGSNNYMSNESIEQGTVIRRIKTLCNL